MEPASVSAPGSPKRGENGVDTEDDMGVTEILDNLAIIEQYYSFPGKKRVRLLQEIVKKEEFLRLLKG
jgi:hypothetical protein